MKRALLALPMALIAALATAPSAGAATTVGQVSNNADPNNCPPSTMLLTTAVSSGAGFTIPAGGGVISSWETNVGSGSTGTDAKLKVMRTTDVANEFLVVGQSASKPMTASALNGPFGVRIPVQAGDFITIRPGDNGGPCNTITGNNADVSKASQGEPDAPDGSTTTFFPGDNTQQRANVAAVLEPDADADGWGDDTQDKCLSLPGPNQGCPVNTFQLGSPVSLKNGFAQLTVTVPGAGTVAAVDASHASSAAKKKRGGGGLIKPVSVAASGPGPVTLTLEPTSAGRKRLARKGKVSLLVQVTFTPSGYVGTSHTVAVTLKKKRPKAKP